MSKGKIYVISGPSGVGKGTIVKALISSHDDIKVSVSATTRSPREGEINGESYYFLTKEEFADTVAKDGFIEHAEYCGNSYGTPKKPVFDMLEKGIDVILEIDIYILNNILY